MTSTPTAVSAMTPASDSPTTDLPSSDSLVWDEHGVARCAWAAQPQLYRDYHDLEWGRPVHGEQALFERISLEAFQSGLAWITILRKRESFRAAFAGFDPERVANFDGADRERLLNDAGIVRNRAKIEATIANAQAVLRLRTEHPGGLDGLFWSFADPTSHRPASMAQVPGSTPASKALAKALKAQGFRFVGPTTAYAAMQACGLVRDHVQGCHIEL